MKKIFCLIILLFPSFALSQPSLKIGVGWPIVIKGGEWDTKGSSARIGVGYSWNLSPKWRLGSTIGIKTPWNHPHPNPRINLVLIRVLTTKFSLGMGLRYEFGPPYDNKPIGNSFAIGISPAWKMKGRDITFSFLIGPGVIVRNKTIWALTLQPQISIPF